MKQPESQLKGVAVSIDYEENEKSSPRPRKRIKYTYSAKEGAHGILMTRSETRTAKHVKNDISDQGPPDNDLLVPSQLLVETRSIKDQRVPSHVSFIRLAKAEYPSSWRLVEGLQLGIDSLLRATTNSEAIDQPGARSLFSTCLKKIPEYIAAEEARAKLNDPDSLDDIPSKVYDQLEVYRPLERISCMPLEETVRAHGIFKIGFAIKDGKINFAIAHSLISLCLFRRAFDEGQHLLSCMISTMGPLSKPRTLGERAAFYLHLEGFAKSTGRFGFQYRTIADCLRNGVLPVEWIATYQMDQCWTRVVSAIIDGLNDAKDAIFLLETAVFWACQAATPFFASQIHTKRLRSQASANADIRDFLRETKKENLRSLVTCKSAMNANDENNHLEKAMHRRVAELLAKLTATEVLEYLKPAFEVKHSEVQELTVLKGLGLQACQSLEVKAEILDLSKHSVSNLDHLLLPLLAAGVASMRDCQILTELSRHFELINRAKPSPKFPVIAAAFLCCVAGQCGIEEQNGQMFPFIEKIVLQLIDLHDSQVCGSETRALVGTVAATTARQFADAFPVPKHVDWAVKIGMTVSRVTVGAEDQLPHQTPLPCTKTKSGFRWEEGLCEWVAPTPSDPVAPIAAAVPQPDAFTVDSPSARSSGHIIVRSRGSPRPCPPGDSKTMKRSPNPAPDLEKHSGGRFLHVRIANPCRTLRHGKRADVSPRAKGVTCGRSDDFAMGLLTPADSDNLSPTSSAGEAGPRITMCLPPQHHRPRSQQVCGLSDHAAVGADSEDELSFM